jgi:hypothetical protein
MGRKLFYKSFAIILFSAAVAFCLMVSAKPQTQQSPSAKPDDSLKGMPGMDMPDLDMGKAQGEVNPNPDAAKAATNAMDDDDMDDMDMTHMAMTDLRPANPADQKRADEIVAQLKPAIEKYKDYHLALDEGFKIFAPDFPQPVYHFTNNKYALKAIFKFDPTEPTSLLYRKNKDGSYTLVGAMYTARKRASEDDINERVPLSVARWHRHVNFCLPLRGTPASEWDLKKFGATGSINTQEACDAANGRFYPQVFGWMVHVYPYRADPAKVWAH